MRLSSSLVSVALYLSLAAAAVISNPGDITSRDNADSTGTGSPTDALEENVGEIIGIIWGSVAPPAMYNGAIKGADEASPL
ncbi:hypothetical protein OG21DRAFT_1484204 [Imleria badia]|nr:hypothetical protein OG21DRAFT_1484204 [Imleria badia]